MPVLPGAQSSSVSWPDRRRARTIACSRPPPPTTRIFIGRDPLGSGVAQSDPAKSSLGIAPSVSLMVVPREPSSRDAFAIASALSASTTLMKS